MGSVSSCTHAPIGISRSHRPARVLLTVAHVARPCHKYTEARQLPLHSTGERMAARHRDRRRDDGLNQVGRFLHREVAARKRCESRLLRVRPLTAPSAVASPAVKLALAALRPEARGRAEVERARLRLNRRGPPVLVGRGLAALRGVRLAAAVVPAGAE